MEKVKPWMKTKLKDTAFLKKVKVAANPAPPPASMGNVQKSALSARTENAKNPKRIQKLVEK
jgi:hypothetical protein